MTEQVRTIFVNSKDRSSGDFNNYTVDVNVTDPFFTLREGERLFVTPSRFSILNDFNNVNTYNKTFNIIVQDVGGGGETEYTLTLVEGVYTSFTLQVELQSRINEWITTYSYPLSCVVTLDEDTQEYNFAFTASTNWFDNYEILFKFSGIETSMALLMGFTDGSFNADADVTSTTSTIISRKAINMVFQPEVEIHSNLVSNNYQTTSEGVIPSQLLFSVNQGAKGDFIVFENTGELFKSSSISQFNTITIRYLDNEGRPILFQSNSRLALKFIKVKENYNDERIVELLGKIEKLTEFGILAQQYLKNN